MVQQQFVKAIEIIGQRLGVVGVEIQTVGAAPYALECVRVARKDHALLRIIHILHTSVTIDTERLRVAVQR